MSSLGTFSIDLSKFVDKAMGNVKQVVGKACLAIGEDIKTPATPFDTGRARAGWIWQTHSKSNWIPPKGHYPQFGPPPVVSSFALGDTLYLANNVEYIKVLEDGWSKQAPAGMVKVTLTRWQNYVAKAVASL